MGPSELPDESRETWGTASAEVSIADIFFVAAAGVGRLEQAPGAAAAASMLASGVYLRERRAATAQLIFQGEAFGGVGLGSSARTQPAVSWDSYDSAGQLRGLQMVVVI